MIEWIPCAEKEPAEGKQYLVTVRYKNKICPRCGTSGYVWYLDNSEYVAKCTNCNHYFRREDFPMCVLDEAPKPITNVDKIRAMTDEELANWYFNEFFPNAPYCNKLECYRDGPCEQCLLDWLRQEAEE